MVHKTGNENISGTKTFIGNISIPFSPSMPYDATNKAYVDSVANLNASQIPITDSGNYFTGENAESALQQLGAKDTIVSDMTYNAPWKSGTPTMNPSDGTITLAGHGFIANQPVEFDHSEDGTSLLPDVLEPYNSDNKGGTYYNVIYIDADHFQVTDTVGGTTPLVPSSYTGDFGWRVRSAGTDGINTTGLNLKDHGEYEIFVIFGVAKRTTVVENFYTKLNSPAHSINFANSTTNYAYSTINIPVQVFQKYSMGYMNIKLTRVNASTCLVTVNSQGQETNDKTTATGLSTTAAGIAAELENEVSSIYLNRSGGNGMFRNGTRIIVKRRL